MLERPDWERVGHRKIKKEIITPILDKNYYSTTTQGYWLRGIAPLSTSRSSLIFVDIA
jgi:hypothetical protein